MASAPIEQTKACTKCGETRPLKDYGRLAASPSGLSPRCRKCECARASAWHQANKDRSNANARAWKAANRDMVSAYNAEYAKADKGKSARFANWANANMIRRREYMRQWHKDNPERSAEYNRLRLQNPAHRVNNALRCRIWSSLNGAKWGRTFDLVGYSLEGLLAHLERQFTKGMSWENYGEWHIDHIIPLSAFDYKSASDPEFRAAWALANLRPLWAKDNLTKSAKRLTLL